MVCHKAGSRDMLARLFRAWPGFECLELKLDRDTGEHTPAQQVSRACCAAGA